MPEKMLELVELYGGYKNKKVLNNVSCTFTKGVNALLGANGSGKSTLLKTLCTAIPPVCGQILYDGKDIYRSGTGYLGKIAMLFQNQPYFPSSAVNEYMNFNAALKGIKQNKRQAVIDRSLERLNVLEYKDLKMKELSGGTRQRVFIAQTIMTDPEIILLDEPSAGLDIIERSVLKETVRALGKKSVVIISTHIVSDIEDLSDKLYILDKGELKYSGSTEDISDMTAFYLGTVKGGAVK